MFIWEKLGRVFNPVDYREDNWIYEFAQAPSVVVFEDYIRVFFSSRPKPSDNGLYVSRMGYIDLNRDNLFRINYVCKEPILPLGELGTFDEFGTYPISVISSSNELRAYYAGWTRCESVPFNAAIGLALSYDKGQSFQKLGQGPVLSYTPDEPFVLGSPKIRKFNNIWYLWYSAGTQWIPNNGLPQPIYKIRMAYSLDGINWNRDSRDVINSVLEQNECQASADVFFFEGKYHMFFSYRYNLNFREEGRGYRIGYASSIDLTNWERNDEIAGIKKSKTGWDSESVSYSHVFELDNTIYMLYQGNEIGRYGFGLAKLEKYIN